MKLRNVGLAIWVLGLCTIAAAGSGERWYGVDYLNGRALVVLSDAGEEMEPVIGGDGIVSVGSEQLDAVFREFECTSMSRLIPDAILDKVPTASPDAYRTYLLKFRTEYPVLAFLDALLATPYVKYAEPDVLQRLFRIPNDDRWNSQYDKSLMGAPAVWDLTTGSPEIICSGLDTGVDWRHPDLRDILWVNPGEDLDGDQEPFTESDYPGDIDDLNGADDDGNGYADDFLGWDFISGIGGCAGGEDCDTQQDNDMYGLESHGTHVGGIMVAQGNNEIGIAGFSWVGKLMALRCGYLASDGQGYMPQSATVPGTYYSIANGADIINMSYGGPGFSNIASSATVAAWQAGLLLFGASGNDNVSGIHYPAGYNDVIAVNATNSNDQKAGFSNYGAWTDISAPGVGIMSTVREGGYQAWDGTSMASPNAAGAAALLWALFPDFTNSSLRDLIYVSATNIDAINPNYIGLLGAGRVDVETAASMLLPSLSVTSSSLLDNSGDSDGRLETGESGTLTMVIAADPNWATATNIQLNVTSSDPSVTVSNGSQSIAMLAPGQAQSVEVTLTAGTIPDAFWLTLDVAITTAEGFDRTVNYTMRVGRGRVLVVDDDGSANFQRFMFDELDEMGAVPDMWSSSLDGSVPGSELVHYPAVFWVCGNETANTLSQDERNALANYLNGGGKLLISGQGIRNDISGESFFADYLHAASDGDAAGDRVVRGATGNTTFGDLNLLLQGGSCANNGQIGPDKILPVNGSIAAFEYTNVGGVGAVMYDGAHKVLYFAFSLEAACGLAGTSHYSVVLQRTLDWWGVSLDAEEFVPASIPASFTLIGNYPNPFNPTSDVRFEVSSSTNVELSVYDIQGRLVQTLVNGVVQPGMHSVQFNGEGLSTGVYFARLAGNDKVQTVKMVLLK
ncbi:S8 family serine peptidase [bacterium]|nr:S8 family serine peptidase [bacterium]